MCGFFVDLSLRFAIILPLATVAGAGRGMLVIGLFLLQSSFLCWMLMTETKESMLGQQLQISNSMKMKRRFSDGSIIKKPNTADTKDKRSDSDSYDHGMLLHEISEHVGQSRCSSVIESKYLLGTTVVIFDDSLVLITDLDFFVSLFLSFSYDQLYHLYCGAFGLIYLCV